MSWPMVRFGDVAQIVTGSTPKAFDENFDGDIPFVTPGDLGELADIHQAKRSLSALGAASVRTVPKRSVMVCCIGATIGKVGFTTRDVATNQQINTLVFDEKIIFPKYAYYYCLTIKSLLVSKSSSTTMPIVNKSNFSDLKMPVPFLGLPSKSLAEQKRIAAILDKADAIRRKRKQVIKLADDFLRSVFLDMFGDPVTNPKGWEVGTFLDICELNPKASKHSDDTEVSFVPMPSVSVSSHLLDASDIRLYSDVKKGFTSFFENDVLFAKITPCMENGKAAIATGLKNNIGFGSTEFHVFRPQDIRYAPYIYSLLHLPLFRKIAANNFSGAVGHKRVPKDFLLSFELMLPPKDLISKFKNIFETVNDNKSKLDIYVVGGDELFNSLSQKAFAGKL
ncbi:restriction endonuclease subunit S [Shewanella frigidimarina]|uniref:restriction endonuclease subunit S n=1 Tax=Shewanella frigidimarina TaxID=56812 RepID=UPI003D7AC64F